ncbi:hypothetical protein VIBNISO65_340023 [Vibrio nigripulchritudo SO65]|uniref:hypothetical protein n=1 Tax=Vibrio nigripulchritudo TaxID=28173 RepID=UPI0003B1C51A|nr:hypothetical protein [Vibrio nigripulchritudo]CCN36562.1 hypothetical protein VIBNIAM115_370023 [Vibrio nigripulchritudo AM115]CCN43624.1 hypothetical protein VIBNIFTn2_590033 [Vibrio nigripulchritudo FTn2]CCN77701.1 hypothetical protein VIBNISO65_340023 [Vibrio nigripulchritudo SO65]
MENMTELQQALLDVRKAQRLLVAFHQRVLPLIQKIGEDLDCNFDYWYPVNHGPAPKGNTNPFNRWYWDYSSLSDAIFFFLPEQTESRNSAPVGAWALTIRLQTDTGISNSFGQKSRNWDALEIEPAPESSQTQLVVSAFRSTQDKNENWAWWNMFKNEKHQLKEGLTTSPHKEYDVLTQFIPIENLMEEESVDMFVDDFKQKLIEHNYTSE